MKYNPKNLPLEIKREILVFNINIRFFKAKNNPIISEVGVYLIDEKLVEK